jgi:TonB-linked SusC/RagA family outer membrane protein
VRSGSIAARALLALGAAIAVLIAQSATLSAQQTPTVAGTVVTAAGGLPLEGAQVVLVTQAPGGRVGAATDASGQFRLTLPQGVAAGQVTLRVTRIGFRPATVVATVGDSELRIALEEQPLNLDQVVVTGTAGGEQRRAVGNVVSTISAPEVLAQSAAPDLASLINARAPGVVITPSTSRLGAGPNIQIRGRSSMSLDNSPLLYVDGVRVNNAVAAGPTTAGGFGSQNANVAGRLNDISPEDIESIEIIKGPAAATIYGTEAANGVIQIITKRGKSGSPRLTAQVQTGALWLRDAENRLPTNYVRDKDSNELIPWNGVRQEKERGTPIFKTGQTRLYNLGLSGGQGPMTYYLSGAYETDLGIEPNNSLKQFNTRANLGVTLTPKIDLAASLGYVSRSNHLGADVGASPMLGAQVGHSALFPAARGFYPNFPPEIPQQLYDNHQAINRFTGSGTLNHRPTDWFTQRLVAGIDYTGDNSRALERFAPPELAKFLGSAVAAGRIFQTLRNNLVATADYSGTAKFDLTPSISSASSIGGQFYRTELNTSTLGGISFAGPGIETVSGTAQPINPSQSQIINTTIGAYFQEQIGWNDRLFLTGAIRVDNNSAFGEDFKWVTYPKVSASWVASEEPFWNVGFVNMLKLRAAYGESGRQPASFSALRTYQPVPGPNGSNAVTPGSAGNSNLKPERGKEIEIGFEALLFNRLSIDVTHYRKRIADQIVSQPIAPSSGFPGNQLANIGEVSNRGFEVQASFQALQRERLSWEIGASLSSNRDRIEDMGDLPSIPSPGQSNIVGYPIGGFFSKRVVQAERDPATGMAMNVLCDGGPGAAPMPCASAPLLYVGTPTPRVSGAVTNTFNVGKRLRLYALVDFKSGNRIYNSIEQLRCNGSIGVGLCDANYHPERYSPFYLAQLSATLNAGGLREAFIQDASFAKLREISASYTLPEGLLARAGVSRAVFTLAARELHTWTKYRGIDPEVNVNNAANSAIAQEQGVVPPLSRLIATLNLTF